MAAGAVLVFLTEKPGYVSMFASGAAGRQGDARVCPAPVKAAAVALIALEAAQDEMKKRLDDDLYLAIVLKESGKVIGEIFGHPEGTAPEDEVQDTFSPCWMLNLNYTGKGYAYEAAHHLSECRKWLFCHQMRRERLQ